MVTTWFLVFTTLVFGLVALRRRDPVLLAIGVSFANYFTLRSIILASAWEPPEPAYLFGDEASALFSRVDLLLAAWLWIILLIPGGSAHRHWSATDADGGPPTAERRVVLWPAVIASAGTVAALVVSQGGFAAAQRFVRLGNEGAGGTGFYLLAPSVLLVVAVWRLRQTMNRGWRASLSPAVALAVSFLTFFTLGSRAPIVAGLVALAIGALVRMRLRNRLSSKVVVGILIAAIAIPQGAILLREIRDQAISGGSAAVSDDAAVSKALNAIFYDAFALVVRDAGTTYDYRGTELLANGTSAAVPSFLWPSKPTYESVGKWLRREYEPTRINGWPPGAPGDWYLMFGLLGIPLGAFVTVVAARLLLRLASRLDPDAGIEVAALWGLMVFRAGVDSEALSRLVVWVAFPLAYVLVTRIARRFFVPSHVRSRARLRELQR